MTRRIAITIFVTVCAAVLAAGLTAWLTARHVLLADLDTSIVRRATLLSVAQYTSPGSLPAREGDRYIIKGSLGRTVGRKPVVSPPPATHVIAQASFIELPEGRFRRLTVLIKTEGSPEPATVIYSAPTAELDMVMRRLAVALTICGIGAGAVAATVSALLAKLSLRPLNRAAAVIHEINEANLDRRMDEVSLPIELRPMAGHLNAMIERLQLAFEQRRRFLADSSHELRTPVAAMITTMEVTLRRSRTNEELSETLEICLAEARHMRQLVQALLSQVRADGSSPTEEAQIFDAAATVKECARIVQSLGSERQIRVVSSAEGSIPIRANPDRLHSVILNLLSNAVEYNHAGGTVEVSATRADDFAEIVIRDDGPGISAEHLPHLFQPFYRANGGRNSNGHLGLGLFLVDSHIKAMGGTCTVESRLGIGTKFRVRLPAAKALTSRWRELSPSSSVFHTAFETPPYHNGPD